MSTTVVDAALSLAADAGDRIVRLGGRAGDGGRGFGQRDLQMVIRPRAPERREPGGAGASGAGVGGMAGDGSRGGAECAGSHARS